MSRANKICATCAHFLTDDYSQQKEHGLGRCTAYDQGESPAISVVAWNQQFTVLYRPAQNMAARRAFIAKMNQKTQPEEATP